MWWKQLKWWMWVVLASVAGFLFWVVWPFMGGGKDGERVVVPTLPETIREKLDTVHEEALEAKVRARVEFEEDIKQLEEIGKVEDGKERRKRLAELLRNI